MTYYARILPWENTNRLDRLTEFRSLVCEYFDNSRGSWEAGIRVEEPLALEAREKINRIMNEIQRIIFYAGVQTVVQYIPPAVIGGYIHNIDLIENIFILSTYRISQNRLIDAVDRAIGVYENNI